jgi:hypothetical protein
MRGWSALEIVAKDLDGATALFNPEITWKKRS